MAKLYYNAGLDYREKLNDNEKAIETWGDLVAVLDSSNFHPTAHYQLFRTYLGAKSRRTTVLLRRLQQRLGRRR